MADWKDTLNLPRTDFPMKANLQTSRAAGARPLEGDGSVRADSRGAARAPEVRPARRAALRERQDPHRHGAEQDPQGFRRQDPARWRASTRRTCSATTATGCRSSSRSTASSGPKKREMSLADFRRACRAYASRFIGVMSGEFQRLGVFGDWDHLVPDDGLPLPGGDRAGAGQVRRAGARLQGQEAGPLVHPLPHGARRSRGRVRGALVAVDLRRVPARAARARRELAARVPALAGRAVSVLIWTTTPWTIPSNLAIAFHPDFDYAAYEVEGRAVILAEALAPRVGRGDRSDARRAGGENERRGPGAPAVRASALHPRFSRRPRRYVTLEQGTGAVHTAPGHGSDDFATGVEYGLEIYAPVGPGRTFPRHGGAFDGQRVFDANPVIVQALETRGRLWHHEAFQHSYPHCWRCHNPVIFLATSQWFIRMDGESGATRHQPARRRARRRRATSSGCRPGDASACRT